MKHAIFKVDVDIDDNGKVKVISYANRKIPYSIFYKLNDAVHEVAQDVNGELDWRKDANITFEHEGVVYEQAKTLTQIPCVDCCFYEEFKPCKHPYFSTKPHCSYKCWKVKDEKKD